MAIPLLSGTSLQVGGFRVEYREQGTRDSGKAAAEKFGFVQVG